MEADIWRSMCMNNEVTQYLILKVISELRKLNATLEEIKNEISSERES